MYKCNRCNKKFEKYVSLSRHATRAHKVSTGQLYVEYFLDGKWPLCGCGCGEKMRWSYQHKMFRKYKHGHQSRVHNNWGHNKKAIEHSAETRRQQYANGEREQWNKGLTVDDERVKKYGNGISNSFTKEKRNKYSKMMKELRLNGTIPTLRGKEHSQWKGGTSSINVLVRARTKLYKEWKYPILCRDGFKCVECGSNKDLHVHHDKELMSEIIEKHLDSDIDIDDFELKDFIADAVVDYHVVNKVSGITLCRGCHGKIHPSLNFT